MTRRMVWISIVFLVSVSPITAAYAQLSYRAETLAIPPGSDCVQVGLFLTANTMNSEWNLLVATLDYTADMGLLGGLPEARLGSFVMMTEPGLTDPATSQPPHGGMSMCGPMNTINSVVQASMGMMIPFMPGNGMVMVSEGVKPMSMDSGRIDLMAGGQIETMGGMEQLFGIVTFPVNSMASGDIHIRFSNAMPGANALIDRNMMTVDAETTDGRVSIMEPGPVPPADAIPTLSEWGVILFLAGVLISTLVLFRRYSF